MEFDNVLALKYILVCGPYFKRKQIMSNFFYNIDSSIIEKNCIGMVFDVCKDWIGYLTLPLAHSYPVCYNVKRVEKKDAREYTTDSILKVKMLYSHILELPCSSELGHNNIPAIDRHHFFTDANKLCEIKQTLTLYGKDVIKNI